MDSKPGTSTAEAELAPVTEAPTSTPSTSQGSGRSQATRNPFANIEELIPRLRADPKTSNYVDDPEYRAMLTEVGKNPQNITRYFLDQRLLETLRVLQDFSSCQSEGSSASEQEQPKTTEPEQTTTERNNSETMETEHSYQGKQTRGQTDHGVQDNVEKLQQHLKAIKGGERSTCINPETSPEENSNGDEALQRATTKIQQETSRKAKPKSSSQLKSGGKVLKKGNPSQESLKVSAEEETQPRQETSHSPGSSGLRNQKKEVTAATGEEMKNSQTTENPTGSGNTTIINNPTYYTTNMAHNMGFDNSTLRTQETGCTDVFAAPLPQKQDTSRTFDVQKMKKIINETTKKVTSRFKIKGLHTPDFRVNPDTVEVKFYETAIPEHEYKPELGFTQQTQMQKGQPIEPVDFFKNNNKGDRVRTVAVVGGAGYGKTELLKRFADDVLEKRVQVQSLEEIEVVHHLNFRDIKEKPNITTGELLFGETDLKKNKMIDQTVECIESNQEKFLLVIDGADQYSDEDQKLGKHSAVKQTKNEAHSTEILNSILSGNIFPGIRILFSSREHAVRYFKDEHRPNRVVALAGFSLPVVKKLIFAFAGEKGQRVWEHLNTKAAYLLSSCSIPMLLVFTVSVLLKHIDQPPETITEVLLYVLNDLTTSRHVLTRSQVYDVIHGLKKMSFKGTEDKKVTFTKSDLPDVDWQDCIIPILGTEARNERLFDGSFRYIFVHQILQEVLAALYVAELPPQEFLEFISNRLHTPHWKVVRQFVCGLLLNKRTNAIARRIDPTVGLLRSDGDDDKRGCMIDSLKERAHVRRRFTEPDLLHALHECGDDEFNVIRSSLKRIDLPPAHTDGDVYVVAAIASRCSEIEFLSLPFLTTNQLCEFAKKIKESEVEIELADLRTVGRVMTHEDAAAICDILPHITKVLQLAMEASDADSIQLLRNKLNELPKTDLKVNVRKPSGGHITLQQQPHSL